MVRRTTRTAVAALGVVAFGLGVLMLVSTPVAAAVPGNATVVTGGGAVLALLGAAIVYGRRNVEIEIADPPAPEHRLAFPVPGDDVDGLLEGRWARSKGTGPVRATGRRERLRRRLDALAVTAVAAEYSCTEEKAREKLEMGAWTDDPHAAAYFLGELPEWAPIGSRIRSVVSPVGQERTRARHAIEAIAAIETDREADS